MHYQPVVRFVSNEVESVEALIRWRKQQGLTVYPINFLGLSEQIGIASQLDEWMIRTACMQRSQWEKEGLGTTRVSVKPLAKLLLGKWRGKDLAGPSTNGDAGQPVGSRDC